MILEEMFNRRSLEVAAAATNLAAEGQVPGTFCSFARALGATPEHVRHPVGDGKDRGVGDVEVQMGCAGASGVAYPPAVGVERQPSRRREDERIGRNRPAAERP